jgi:hypothetical protein
MQTTPLQRRTGRRIVLGGNELEAQEIRPADQHVVGK